MSCVYNSHRITLNRIFSTIVIIKAIISVAINKSIIITNILLTEWRTAFVPLEYNRLGLCLYVPLRLWPLRLWRLSIHGCFIVIGLFKKILGKKKKKSHFTAR